MRDFDSYVASYERYRQAVNKANALNKAMVFGALARANITTLTMDFNGEGDNGQLDNLVLRAGDATASLPTWAVTLYQAHGNSEQLTQQDMTLQDAIETLCYGYLDQEHEGWENDAGAYGTFRFDVAAHRIVLEFHGRLLDIITSNHTF